jgi:LDH2 family malate/lactate/ureidoglycolate dehydrogenase
MMAAAADLPRFGQDDVVEYPAAILGNMDVPALDARTVAECLTASPPLPGIPRVLAPGEPELEAESRNRKFGIPIANEVVCELTDIGNEFGVAFPGVLRRSSV